MNGFADIKFSFGDVTVNPQTNVILVAGKEKRLEPKLIALLVYLAQHAQQVITRQQITETIWPDVIVGEESITQAIFALRNALGDDAKRPKYIETIPKKGYRFLATVEEIKPQEELQLSPPPWKLKWQTLSALVSVGVLIVLSLLWYTRTSTSHHEITSILPITKMPGAECCMAINNNHKMAFVNIVNDVADIYVKDLVTGTQERITQDEWPQKESPLWLDDNTLIYNRCVGHIGRECQIVEQHLQRSPRILYTSTTIGDLIFSANSSLLFFNEYKNDNAGAAVEANFFDLRTGNHGKLRTQYPELPPAAFRLTLSADAKQLFFVSIDAKYQLMALDFSTKKVQLISDQFNEITSLTFNHQQQLIIAGTHDSITGLWLLDKTEEKPTLIVRATGNEQYLSPVVDPDGSAIYYNNIQFNRDIGVIYNELDISNELPDLNSMGTDAWATLSKDQQFIYFTSDRSGFSEAWSYDLNKKRATPLTHLNKFTELSFILPSNDGQRFSAAYNDGSQDMLGIFSVHNGELLASLKSSSWPLSWSHDDKYLYIEVCKNNIYTLMRYDSQTLEATEIQKNAGHLAQESKDGNSLMFIDFEKNALVERNLVTHKNQILLSMDMKLNEIWIGRLRIDSTLTSVLVIKQNRDVHQLWQYPFKSHDLTPKKLLDLPKDTWVTYINDQGTRVFTEKHMPLTGDIMKMELR